MSTENTNSDQNSNRVEIPKQVNIGGQSYLVDQNPELKALVEAARKDAAMVERTKLYPTIEKVKNQIKQLGQTEIVPTNASEAPKTVLGGDDQINKLLQGFRDIVQPLVKANADQQAQTIQGYREQLLQENAGKVIPELVVGETKEALDAALTASRASFEKLRGQFGQKTVEEQLAEQRAASQQAAAQPQQPQPTASTPIAQTQETKAPETPSSQGGLPSAPATTQMNEKSPSDVSRMGIEEFGTKREDLLKELESLVPTQS